MSPKVLIMLFACATAVAASSDSGASRLNYAHGTTESRNPMGDRFVEDPAKFQFSTSKSSTKQFPLGETHQIAEQTSMLQDEIDKPIKGQRSRNTSEVFDEICFDKTCTHHEISSFYVLIFLIAFCCLVLWTICKCCCRCRKRATNRTSFRRTPSFRDTVIQRLEDICLHRIKVRPHALEMSRMMQETV